MSEVYVVVAYGLNGYESVHSVWSSKIEANQFCTKENKKNKEVEFLSVEEFTIRTK